MLSRLSIIGFLLCLPIAIALFSQQVTRTVAPPKLPTVEQPVKLLAAPRNGRNQAAALGQEVGEGYTLRTIKHWGEALEDDALQAQTSEPHASGSPSSKASVQPGAQLSTQPSAQPAVSGASAMAVGSAAEAKHNKHNKQ